MLRHRPLAVVVLLALAPADGMAKPTKLDSREYKMMLDEGRFAGAAPEQTVAKFWEKYDAK